MINKVLGILISMSAAYLTIVIFKDDLWLKDIRHKESICIQLTPSQQLINLITNDFQKLNQSKQLPKEWTNIETTEIKMNSELAKIILGKARPSFSKVKNGKFHLELEVMDLPDAENPGVILQASLFNKKTKNKIFEIGRKYTMNDLNKVPDSLESTQRTTSKAYETKSSKETKTNAPLESPTD